jgi:hypothetical protein
VALTSDAASAPCTPLRQTCLRRKCAPMPRQLMREASLLYNE